MFVFQEKGQFRARSGKWGEGGCKDIKDNATGEVIDLKKKLNVLPQCERQDINKHEQNKKI